jgi:hypothetical protein
MKATCPHCGFYGPVEAFLTEGDAKAALAMISGLPGNLPRLTWSYLGLFRKPGANRAMTWSRVLRTVSALADLVRDRDVQWKGSRVVANRPEYWEQGIEAMVERDAQGRLKRPLENHNYLRAIVAELAEKGFEQGHKQKERELRYKPTDGRRVVSAEEQARMDEQALEENKKRALGNIARIKEQFGLKRV